MSLYRCAFLLCRALSLFLVIEAFIRLMEVVVYFILRAAGILSVSSNFVSPVIELVTAFGIYLFANSISASFVGESVLQGESIRANQNLMPTERSMVLGFTGVLLLVFGFIGGATSAFSGAMMFLFTPSSRSALMSPFAFYGVSVCLAFLKVILGFYLVFLRGIRQMG